jgi:plasmid stabilization system protein ParE
VSLAVTLHSLAELDVVEAWEWYEQQQPGLGDLFVAAVGAAIARAARWPNAGTPAIHDDNGEVVERRVATTGFPYAVRYRVADGQLVVMAVYHQRRRPDFGADRLP